MTEPQLSGVDLAMQALRQARAAAKAQPASRTKRRPKARLANYGNGRDPNPVADVLEQLAVAYNWRRPSAAGQIMARWERVAPNHHKLGSPERFDEETRTLYLRPVSDGAATKLRWESRPLAAALNDQVGAGTVEDIKVLPVGAAKATGPAPAEESDREVSAASSVSQRVEPSPGYRAALEAHQEHVRTDHGNTALKKAIAAAANRAPVLRERDGEFTDAVAFRDDLEEQATKSADARARALAVARAEKAGRAPALPTVFQRTA